MQTMLYILTLYMFKISLSSQVWSLFYSRFLLPGFGIFSSAIIKIGLKIAHRNICQVIVWLPYHLNIWSSIQHPCKREVFQCHFWGGEWGSCMLLLLRGDIALQRALCDLSRPSDSLAGMHGTSQPASAMGFSSQVSCGKICVSFYLEYGQSLGALQRSHVNQFTCS